ncbi:MAG TPA: hypothetical protein VM580_08190 [Labilithrix sp.]|jgi:hypothetical protein|nr:hypothetical protein [Labilithrix sp.]
MSVTEPTYFLYSGRLFHAVALPALDPYRRPRGDDSTDGPHSRRGESSWTPQPRRGEDPGPEGPEGEPVGEDDEREIESTAESLPSPGPGTAIAPEHESADDTPIDPRSS